MFLDNLNVDPGRMILPAGVSVSHSSHNSYRPYRTYKSYILPIFNYLEKHDFLRGRKYQ